MALDTVGEMASAHFIDSIGDPVLVVDSELTIAVANRAAERLYRARPGVLTGSLLLDRCPAEHHDAMCAAVASCNGTPHSFTVPQLAFDGGVFHTDITAATCHHHASPSVTLVVRERPAHEPCDDELAIRDIALENALDGVIAHTLDGHLLFANRAACEQWGLESMEQACNLGPFGWLSADERPILVRRLSRLQELGEDRFDTRGQNAAGAELNVEVHARLVDTNKGPLVVSTARDITERIQTEEMVRYLAYHDMLTGLANRVRLEQELVHEIAAADRHSDILGVIFIDLNDFKPVNDTFGHTIGDHVLREVADRLAGSVRENDTVARLGGDEFVIVLPRLRTAADLPLVAQKLSEEISRPIELNGRRITVSGTFGMAVHVDGEDADSLLIRADLAMYDARERQVPGWELFAY